MGTAVSGQTLVVVGGAINTDLVSRTPRSPERGETVTGRSFAIHGGGKGANQAVAAARSGASVVMVGAVGRDDFGAQRLRELASEGIALDAVTTLDDVASGVAQIFVEDSGDNRILYVPGATLSVAPSVAETAVPLDTTGVLLLTLELPALVRGALIRRGKAAGMRIVLNATPEPEAAIDVLPDIDVLIVNEPEARALAAADEATDPTRREDRELEKWSALGRRVLAMGAGRVVLTLGDDGARLVAPHREVTVVAPSVSVVDTTGAGDALCGAFAARLAAGDTLEDALRWGVAAGSLACTVSGAQPSIPGAGAIAAMLDRMTIAASGKSTDARC